MEEHSATLPPPQKKNISKRTSRNSFILMETICLGNKIASNLKLIFYFIYNFLFFKTVPIQTNILIDKPDTRTGRIN